VRPIGGNSRTSATTLNGEVRGRVVVLRTKGVNPSTREEKKEWRGTGSFR
jgi:hypothetical protein